MDTAQYSHLANSLQLSDQEGGGKDGGGGGSSQEKHSQAHQGHFHLLHNTIFLPHCYFQVEGSIYKVKAQKCFFVNL